MKGRGGGGGVLFLMQVCPPYFYLLFVGCVGRWRGDGEIC